MTLIAINYSPRYSRVVNERRVAGKHEIPRCAILARGSSRPLSTHIALVTFVISLTFGVYDAARYFQHACGINFILNSHERNGNSRGKRARDLDIRQFKYPSNSRRLATSSSRKG